MLMLSEAVSVVCYWQDQPSSPGSLSLLRNNPAEGLRVSCDPKTLTEQPEPRTVSTRIKVPKFGAASSIHRPHMLPDARGTFVVEKTAANFEGRRNAFAPRP